MSDTIKTTRLEGTELVILSACQTAQGVVGEGGEGIFGLVRSLRVAGAANVLAALRPVGDREAREFVIRFYAAWLEDPAVTPAVDRGSRQAERAHWKEGLRSEHRCRSSGSWETASG